MFGGPVVYHQDPHGTDRAAPANQRILILLVLVLHRQPHDLDNRAGRRGNRPHIRPRGLSQHRPARKRDHHRKPNRRELLHPRDPAADMFPALCAIYKRRAGGGGVRCEGRSVG